MAEQSSPQDNQPVPAAVISYLGVEVAHPRAPPSPSEDAFKLPGYDAEKDYLRLQEMQMEIDNGQMKETEVIAYLRRLTLKERDALNDYYRVRDGMALPLRFKGTVSFRKAWAVLYSVTWGPLIEDIDRLKVSLDKGYYSKPNMMFATETLLDRPPDELKLLIDTYQLRWGNTLVDAVDRCTRGDLQRLFRLALAMGRPADSAPVDHEKVVIDVAMVVQAATHKTMSPIVDVFSNSSRPHLATVITAYAETHKSTVSKVIKKHSSGNLRDALLYILHGAKATRDGRGIWRDAKLLEATMAGFGTRDDALTYRVMRAHWNRPRFEEIQAAYEKRYGKTLAKRVHGEASGEHRSALQMIIQDGGR